MAFALNDDKGNRTDGDKLAELQRNCREGSLKYLEEFYCQDHLAISYFYLPLPGPKGYTLLHEAVEVRDRNTRSCPHCSHARSHYTYTRPPTQCGAHIVPN